MTTWERELEAATEAALAGGRATLRWFQAGPDVETKADGSPVTAADRESERVMRDALRRRFPDDAIMGEEAGEDSGSSGRRWVLDPIDGTRSFINGVPLYGVMVGLVAATGLGCRWNGRPCRVRETPRLEDALVLTSGDGRLMRPGHPEAGLSAQAPPDDGGLARRVAAIERIAARVGTFRTWGDCYGYALVATGRADAMLDPVLSLWDTVAARPVIEEAGGVFTDWTGRPSHASGHAVATTRALSDTVRAELHHAP